MVETNESAVAVTSLLDKLDIKEQIPLFDDAYPSTNPVDIFRVYITSQLVKLTGKDAQIIFQSLGRTSTLEQGDLKLPVHRLQMNDAPLVHLPARLAAEFPSNRLLRPVGAVGMRLRFDFNPDVIASLVLPYVFTLGAEYGVNKSIGLLDSSSHEAGKRKIVVEFSSPNIAKEFHIGHLRSTIIGAFLSNLHEAMGWDVVRLNYLGDWGRQYGLLVEGWKKYGSEEAFLSDPISHLFEIYVKISTDMLPEEKARKVAKKRGEDTSVYDSRGLLGAAKRNVVKMESGDEEMLALWRRFRSISIDNYKRSYARLNIVFDEYSGESEVGMDTMEEVLHVLEANGITEVDNGATLVDFKKHGPKKLEIAIVRNRNGTSSYLLRDIGAAIQRFRNHGMERMMYVIMSQQDFHVQQFFRILQLMGGEYAGMANKMQHVTFGRIRGMSTRRGSVKFLGDVLNDVGDAMHDVMRRNTEKYAQVQDPDRVADCLGISSIMVQDMSGKRINDYDFDLQRMLSFEGDTGPYLQYAHARLCSIARKTQFTRERLAKADFSLLYETHAVNLVRLIASWPDTVMQTYHTLEPTTVVTYLFRLAHQLSSSYDVLKVLGASEGHETSLARAALYEAARQVLHNGMVLLGLSPVESM